MASLVIPSILETLYMVSVSTLFSLIMGFPLGILLVITERGNVWEKPFFNNVLNSIINIFRSFPFLILMILLLPLSRLLLGKSIGTTAMIIPLSIAAAPFVARVMEGSLKRLIKVWLNSAFPWEPLCPKL